MNVEISNREVLFQKGGCLAGRYVLDDPFKPHFAILNTTAGHNVTLVSPADHRHHKGLMYALRCADLNFWEEDPDGGTCGVQEVLDTHPIVNGIRQTLLWRALEGDRPTYRESREITCTLAADGGGYHWLWRTRREALRNHRLIKSEWSMALPDGRKINYHGLGLIRWCRQAKWQIATATFANAIAPIQKSGYSRARCGQREPCASRLRRISRRPAFLSSTLASLTASWVSVLKTLQRSSSCAVGYPSYRSHWKMPPRSRLRRTLI